MLPIPSRSDGDHGCRNNEQSDELIAPTRRRPSPYPALSQSPALNLAPVSFPLHSPQSSQRIPISNQSQDAPLSALQPPLLTQPTMPFSPGSIMRQVIDMDVIVVIVSEMSVTAQYTAGVWFEGRLWNVCFLIYALPVTLFNILVLSTTQTSCDTSVLAWFLIHTLLLPLNILACLRFLHYQSHPFPPTDYLRRLSLIFLIIWSLVGGFIVFTSSRPLSPIATSGDKRRDFGNCLLIDDALFTTAFYEILIQVSAVIVWAVMSCCLPCILVLYLHIFSSSPNPTRAANKEMLNRLDECVYTKSIETEACAICLGEYGLGEVMRLLPCRHYFHKECVDSWLLRDKSCPLCKRDIDWEAKDEEKRREKAELIV
ncbi:uncharacterized protein VTP21DRAFT_1433 [Calcarisporiella thermophila]|uniref:uncharacterized protein n=1 Tax=Calcarisporiella thermophila TaxID=911321 RepID=UPI00374359E1